MDAEKIRNLTSEELSHQEKDMSDQLFKLKFQLNMGQTESLTKLRGLRKDIARVKTIVRERAGATATSVATPAAALIATSTVKSTVKSKSEKK
jgi:large subunit ribosomal protein L29